MADSAVPVSPWAKFAAKTWKRTFPEFAGLEITFRETGDTAALISLLQGGANDEKVAAKLILTSVIEPHISAEEFYSLSLGHKTLLVTEILEHAGSAVGDFRPLPPAGPAPAPTTPASTTPSGSPGEQPSVSVSLPRPT